MYAEIVPLYNATHTIHLAGHSFGGAITMMLSVYYAQLGQLYDTVLIGKA